MVVKFFSKNKRQIDAKDENIKNQISDFLYRYRCKVFPEGFYALATKVNINVNRKSYLISAQLPFPCDGLLNNIAEQITEEISCPVHFDVTYTIEAVRQHNISGVKNILAVSSGKGGVGKSTTAVNLAYALIAEGANVGILDADIYGPSIPKLLDLVGKKPSSSDGKLMTPHIKNHLAAMSIGFLVDEKDATVWRGPMASRAFSQLLNETDWPDLDYLIIDMPPGTGDIQLTLAQQVPVAAAMVITTPQDIALIDAMKGIAMFEQVKIPVLGVIENMSYHLCENCGHKAHIFSQGGADKIATEFQTQILGQLPLDRRIQESADQGLSLINENNASELVVLYRTIARLIASQTFYQLDMRSPNTANVIIK